MNRCDVIRAGLRDGWTQPYDLGISHSVPEEHQELLDKAINLGQLARAGRNSETYKERFWPLKSTTKDIRDIS